MVERLTMAPLPRCAISGASAATRKYGTFTFSARSYWIPGSYAPALSEKRNSFLRLLKNKGFKEQRRTKIGLYAIGKSTTLESNKSLQANHTTVKCGATCPDDRGPIEPREPHPGPYAVPTPTGCRGSSMGPSGCAD